MITALRDAPQQIMGYSSNQRHTGTLGFRGGEFFNSHKFFAPGLRKPNRRILQGDGFAYETCPNISGSIS